MRFLAKVVRDRKILREMTIEDFGEKSRTEKVFGALQAACESFDLAVPIWLNANIREFQRTAKVRFSRDSFVEEIAFSSLELEVLEED